MVKSFLLTLRPRSVTADSVQKVDAGRIVFTIAVAAVVLMVLLNVFRRVSYIGDEGFYGITALNMLHSPDYLLRPSYYPLGDFMAEQDAFAHPPLNSYLYALALWISNGSFVGLEILNALSFAVFLFFAYRLLSLFDLQGARFAVVLLAASPAILHAWSEVEAEPLMSTAGTMALYYAARSGLQAGRRTLLFLCGLCLGLAFALKLWLFGPYVLAVSVLLLSRAWQAGGTLAQKLRPLFLVALGAIIPAGLHLLAVAWFHPEDLQFWLRKVYFGFFIREGISGGKFTGDVIDPRWVHPVWYYAGVFYRDHFFLVPMVLLGISSLLRDARFKRGFLWMIIAGVIGLIPVSFMKIKEPMYILSCTVFIYFLAAACLAALVRRLSTATADKPSGKIGTAIVVTLLVLFPFAYAWGIKPREITPALVLAHSVILTLTLLIFWWGRRTEGRFLEWTIYGACAAGVVIGFFYDGITRRPRDETITRMIRPYIEGNSTEALSLVATEFKSYQFYTFRRGCYWDELPLHQSPATVFGSPELSHTRAFVIEPEDLVKPEMVPWIAWLEKHATEKTAELNTALGKDAGLRLFIR
jgi:hypothetical protein